MHLGRVLEMAESSATKWEYEAKIAKRFGFAQQLELPIPLPPSSGEARGRRLGRPTLAQRRHLRSGRIRLLAGLAVGLFLGSMLI